MSSNIVNNDIDINEKIQSAIDNTAVNTNANTNDVETQTNEVHEKIEIITNDIINLTIPNPTTLVLSGGSVRGFGLLGAISFLDELGALNKIKRYVATSVGAIISTLLSIGYSPFEIYNHVQSIRTFDKDEMIKMSNILSLILFRGLYSVSKMLDPIYRMIHRKAGITVTLKNIQEIYQKTLVFCTYDITNHRTVYLSPENNPDMLVTDALAMTCCLPLLFNAYEFQDAFYIDGGLADVFPIKWAIDHPQPQEEYILGINLQTPLKPTDNVIEYFYNLFSIPISILLHDAYEIAEKCPNVKIIDIDVENISILGYNVNQNKLFDIYDNGYQQIKNQIGKITKKLVGAR